jgi:hypothetical protein
LWILVLDVEAERGKKAPGEQLHALCFIEVAGAGKKGLKTVLILLDCTRTLARRELEEGGRA